MCSIFPFSLQMAIFCRYQMKISKLMNTSTIAEWFIHDGWQSFIVIFDSTDFRTFSGRNMYLEVSIQVTYFLDSYTFVLSHYFCILIALTFEQLQRLQFKWIQAHSSDLYNRFPLRQKIEDKTVKHIFVQCTFTFWFIVSSGASGAILYSISFYFTHE